MIQRERRLMSDKTPDIPEYQDNDLLTLKQVAELIDRTSARVHQLIADLEIPHQKFGRTIVVKYKDLGPIFERNTIRGYTPPDDE